MNLAQELAVLRRQVKQQEICRLKEENEFFEEASVFCCQPSEVSKNQRMRFIDL